MNISPQKRSPYEFLQDISGFKKLKTQALEDMSKAPEPLPVTQSIFQELAHQVLTNPGHVAEQACNSGYQRPLAKAVSIRSRLAQKTVVSQAFQKAEQKEKAALLLSHLGVGPGKAFQILASDESIDPGIRKVLAGLKSSGAATRSLKEAQAMTDKLYGAGKYILSKLAGVGTIGETYQATARENKPVIIKMVKNGVSEQLLNEEWQLAQQVIRSAYLDSAKQKFQLHKMSNLYKQWISELDFQAEADNAKALAQDATSYKVAQTIEAGKLPGAKYAMSMVQEQADGMALDELMKLLTHYKENPSTYQRSYQQEIAQHPWLKNPNLWMNQLADLYRDSFNEQIMLRIKKGVPMASHGDPHAGNLFIQMNQETQKLEVTYIDAGLVAMRDSKKAANHLGLLVNTMIGNSEVLAKMLVDSAEILPERPREELIQEIKSTLDEKLFKARVNLTDAKYNSQLFDKLMQDKGIFIPEQETAFFKAQMQVLMNYEELAQLTGKKQANYLRDSLSDIVRGAGKLLWNEPVEAIRHLSPAAPHLYSEGRDALRNLCQFFISNPPLR
jgi:predicted unusual protein kinase regulating ubiquinone biosynthesis (AarF/ABC1/UbiB family)